MGRFSKLSPTCQIKNLDLIYEKFFEDISSGTFIEVGGHDGYSWSNTWGLAEIGWGGMYIEPIHELAEKCRKIHEKNYIKVIEVAVGAYDGEVEIYMDSTGKDDSSATIDLDSVNSNSYAIYSDRFTRRVPIKRLDSIIPGKLKFELLVIDVEGAEIGVLKGFSLENLQPKMIIIETHRFHWVPQWKKDYPEINQILTDAGYEEYQSDLINSIYVRN